MESLSIVRPHRLSVPGDATGTAFPVFRFVWKFGSGRFRPHVRKLFDEKSRLFHISFRNSA